MADQDIKMLIERIMAEARTHQSARFSNEIYADEPIQDRPTDAELPPRPVPAKCVRYRVGKKTQRGRARWLSEAELFTAKASLMADFEDDCPYNGTPLSRTFPPTTP